jgi:long-chain acyl-CoA synthetase
VTRTEALAQLTAKGQTYELVEIAALGRSIRAFANAPATLRDIFEQSRSDLPFIVYENERLSFEDVWLRSSHLAAVMARDYGIKKGDRVAISMRNYPEWIIAFNAATSLGAIAVAMNALWQPHEMQFALTDSGARLLFADQERLDRLAACDASPPCLKVIAVRDTGSRTGAESYSRLLSPEVLDAMPIVDLRPDDDAIML